MKELFAFLKDIFMINKSDVKVGLSQFKGHEIEEVEPKPVKIQKEVKLSDLMRKSA